jgi:hypothetical protein
MRFPVFRENLVDDGVGLEACGLKARFDHPQSPEGKNRALERLVGLKPYDNFVVAIDVAGLVGKQCRGSVSVDCKHPLCPFLGEIRLQFRPDGPGALRWSSEKSFVTCVRRGISDNETANVDGTEPISRLKIVPAIFGLLLPPGCVCLHGESPTGLDK